MNISILIISPNWSFDFFARSLAKVLRPKHVVHVSPSLETTRSADVVLHSNVSAQLLRCATRRNVICRFGSFRSLQSNRITPRMVSAIGEAFAVVASNQALADLSKRYNERVFLIPNGLDLAKWTFRKGCPRRFTVGFAGNISCPSYRDHKGFVYVKEACAQTGVDLKVALWGSNYIPHRRMRAEFYNQISCLVLPTLSEGCSNVIMESLACGVPVLTTKEAGYHGELLEHGKNVFFVKRDVGDIAVKLTMLQVSIELQHTLAHNGRRFAEAHHDIYVVAKKYESIFQKCLKAQKTRGGNPCQQLKTESQS